MKFEEALVELRKCKEIELNEHEKIIIRLCKNREEFSKIEYSFDIQRFSTKEVLNRIIFGDWVVSKSERKTFDQVVKEYINGKSIKRRSCKNVFRGDRLDYGEVKFYCNDLLATDWEVVE